MNLTLSPWYINPKFYSKSKSYRNNPYTSAHLPPINNLTVLFINMTSKPKKTKHLCTFSTTWINEQFEVDIDGEKKSYSGTVLSGKNGEERAFCNQCKTSFSVSHGGTYDVKRHFKSALHNNALKSAANTARLQSFGFGESATSKTVREKKRKNENKRFVGGGQICPVCC